MDSLFLLEPAARATFLRLITQSFGGTYICLWSHSFDPSPPPSNHLTSLDGFYDEAQPGTSSQSSASTLFVAYRELVVPIDDDIARVPGYAFRNNRPYIELNQPQLQALSSHQTQRHFYREANIKTAVFMGCRRGEIELGLSNVPPQMNIEMGLKKFFPEDFCSWPQLSPVPDLPQPSSSSSSLRSLSTESPDSSLIFAMPSGPRAQPEAMALQSITDAALAATAEPHPREMQALSILSSSLIAQPKATDPHQEEMQALSNLRSPQLPTLEAEERAMTNAILAVLTSPSSSSSAPPQFLFHLFQPMQQQNLPYETATSRQQLHQRASAFKSYASTLRPAEPQVQARLRRQSMMKRSILYYGRLNIGRPEYRVGTGARPTATQLHHMMSERKRREKQNELFQALRSLLPPGTKKDKSAVLTTAREQLSLLQQQVAELRKKNELLEAQLLSPGKQVGDEEMGSSSSSRDRFDVRISEVSESTSEGSRLVDLQIRVRGECPMDHLMIRLLDLLRPDPNLSLMSMEARAGLIIESVPLTYITMRLKIQGNGWDEPTFLEAVRRVVADVAP